jgi:DNA-binding cell septation regulator SpoVG
MFNKNSETKKTDNVEYVVKVDKVITTKNDDLVMVNIDVNGVLVSGCTLKEVTVKEDGKKYKKGDKCFIFDFPQRKVGDKYYRTVWFPVSSALTDSIVDQVKKFLEG